MAKKRAMRIRGKMCDPALCDHCEYIGEGDFICDKYEDEDGNPIAVMVEWEPTADFMKCGGNRA